MWIRCKGSLRDKLGWLFDIYDIDKNNSIDLNELNYMLRLIFKIKGIDEDPAYHARHIMDYSDRNGDGKLNKQEFIAACVRNESLSQLFTPF